MSESKLRKRRSSKTITNFFPEFSDDDDFASYSPPSKKNKETKSFKNDEVEGQNLKKSPKQRKSIADRKFQRELDLALKLSSQESNSCFEGFNENESKNDHKDPSNLPASFQTSNVTQELNEEYLNLTNTHNPTNKPSMDSEQSTNEVVSNPSNQLNKKRVKKQVNFVEEDSDEFEEDFLPTSVVVKSSDEEFFPSPKKKKDSKQTKNKNESKPKSTSKKKSVALTDVDTNKVPNFSDLPKKISPHEPIQHNLDDVILNDSPEVIDNNDFSLEKRKLATEDKISAKLKKTAPKKSNNIVSPTSKLSDITKSASLNPPQQTSVRTPFNSPTINGVSQPWSTKSPSSSSVPVAKSSLRLGLSKRGKFKPLHSNVGKKC